MWSALRTLGVSRLVSLTMLTPFLGTIIIFNQSVVDLLRIPDEIAAAFGLVRPSPFDLSSARLKLTYFGLVFLGMASFSFAILCPNQVKRYASAAEFVQGDRELFTPPAVSASAGDLAIAYDDRTLEHDYGREATFSYPDALLRRFETVFSAIARPMIEEMEIADAAASEARPLGEPIDTSLISPVEQVNEGQLRWEEEHNLWMRPGGGIDTSKLVKLMQSGRQGDRWYLDEMLFRAREHVIDIMVLEYGTADASRPAGRLAIMLLFGAGFALLFLPTAMTFAAVLRSVF